MNYIVNKIDMFAQKIVKRTMPSGLSLLEKISEDGFYFIWTAIILLFVFFIY